MVQLRSKLSNAADEALARSLAKLWPHREHEANSVKALLCWCGLHPWRSLALDEVLPDREVRFCFWCSKVKIDGLVYRG